MKVLTALFGPTDPIDRARALREAGVSVVDRGGADSSCTLRLFKNAINWSDGFLMPLAAPANPPKEPKLCSKPAAALCCCWGGINLTDAVKVGAMEKLTPKAKRPAANGPRTIKRKFSTTTCNRSSRLISSSALAELSCESGVELVPVA